MRHWLSAALSLILLNSLSQAQVVQWDLEKRHGAHKLRRRENADSTATSTIFNKKSEQGYYAKVNIGTPSQELTLQIDTGSSDLWVPASSASVCSGKSESAPEGCNLGSFNSSQSDTFHVVGDSLFDISYADGSHAKGDYFQDELAFGGHTLDNFTMGLGTDSTISQGIIGLGYANNEAVVDVTGGTYPNLPVAMQKAGIINTVAYSLWLNDLDAQTGNILFGGIDTEKYVGDLTKIKILEDTRLDAYLYSTVSLVGISAKSPTGEDTLTSEDMPLNVVLDSGTTLTYIPEDLASQLWDEVGAYWEPAYGFAILPCSAADNKGHFSFIFSSADGPKINVTLDELVLDLTNGNPPKFTSGPYAGDYVCEFGIQNQTSSPYVLGDTFLRSAYVVYDLVNNEVALAQTDFNSTGSNIVAFESHGAKIPSATAVSSGAQATALSKSSASDLKAADGFQDGEESAAVLSIRGPRSWLVGMTLVAAGGAVLL